ncbi:hypothetical protein BGW42_005344 [Actinomortierella wolfii]|nr:hypothetical protein BGW42_005344 [Actinomortierella wolfii]
MLTILSRSPAWSACKGVSHAYASLPFTLRYTSIRALSSTRVALNTAENPAASTNESVPFRLAVIGSGPGGFYTAQRVLRRLPNAKVDMFEALPIPHGLVRYGVAPDHPEVKNVMSTFDEVAENPNFRFIGNTSVGTLNHPDAKPAALEMSDLQPNYHAILLAYGAPVDRTLGVPGEDRLKGVMGARTFVGFYNGLPSEQDLDIDLSKTDTAVVLGQGNVALDVARILLMPLEELKKTDLTENAIKLLEKSTIKHVHIVGRRGPLEVAFTAKELREMINLPDTTFHMDKELFESEMAKGGKSLDRPRKRLMSLLEKGMKESKPNQNKSWTLSFLRSPKAFKDSPENPGVLSSIEFGINRLESQEGGPRRAVDTGKTEELKCGLAFRSIGYKSLGIKGIPFDDRKGIVPNIGGKVVDSQNNIVPGLYTSGWLKTGPVGVIVSTMAEAFQTAETLIEDVNSGALGPLEPKAGAEPLMEKLKEKGVRTVSYQDWKKLEQIEFQRGAELGKPREKVLSVEEMLRLLD